MAILGKFKKNCIFYLGRNKWAAHAVESIARDTL